MSGEAILALHEMSVKLERQQREGGERMNKPTHEVTFVLDNGAVLTSEATYEDKGPDFPDPLEDILDYIENDREGGNWKIVGEMAAFHRRIVAVSCKEL